MCDLRIGISDREEISWAIAIMAGNGGFCLNGSGGGPPSPQLPAIPVTLTHVNPDGTVSAISPGRSIPSVHDARLAYAGFALDSAPVDRIQVLLLGKRRKTEMRRSALSTPPISCSSSS